MGLISTGQINRAPGRRNNVWNNQEASYEKKKNQVMDPHSFSADPDPSQKN
jgi:hypothetical protein